MQANAAGQQGPLQVQPCIGSLVAGAAVVLGPGGQAHGAVQLAGIYIRYRQGVGPHIGGGGTYIMVPGCNAVPAMLGVPPAKVALGVGQGAEQEQRQEAAHTVKV